MLKNKKPKEKKLKEKKLIMLKGERYRRTHKQSVIGILGNDTPDVFSRGSMFFNKDRWTTRYLIKHMCEWAKENPECVPVKKDVAEWVKEANDEEPPHREIVIANTPDLLPIRTAMALTGGAYHEAFHSKYSCRRPLETNEIADVVIPRWAKVKDWSVLTKPLLEWSNIIEDIRIEQCGRKEFEGVFVKLCDLQDFILAMEKKNIEEGKARMEEVGMPGPTESQCTMSIITRAFRDLGLGYNTEIQRDAIASYKKENIEACDMVSKGPLRPLVDACIKMKAHDDIGCLTRAMDVLALIADLAEQNESDQENQQQGAGDGETKCPKCGAEADKLVVRPKPDGNGGKVKGKGIVTCTVCGYQEEIDVQLKKEKPQDDQQSGKPQKSPKFEGFDPEDFESDEDGENQDGQDGDDQDGDEDGDSQDGQDGEGQDGKEGDDSEGQNGKGKSSGKDGDDQDGDDDQDGSGSDKDGDEDSDEKSDGSGKDEESDEDGDSEGSGKDSDKDSDKDGDEDNGHQEHSGEDSDGDSDEDSGEDSDGDSGDDSKDSEGTDDNGDPDDETETGDGEGDSESDQHQNAAGGHDYKDGPLEGNDWSNIAENAMEDAAAEKDTGIQNNNSALQGAFEEAQDKEDKIIKLKSGEQIWKPYDPSLDIIEFVKPSSRGKEYDREQAGNVIKSVKAESAYFRARLRTVIRSIEMTSTYHGVSKGRGLSNRFLVDSKICLKGRQSPNKAYYKKGQQVDMTMAAAIVVDESSSMGHLLELATRMMTAIVEPLDSLGCATMACGFRNGWGAAKNQRDDIEIDSSERGKGYHRFDGVRIDVFKTWHERFKTVQWRFANTQATGSTPMADGTEYALQELSSREEAHRFMFVITDGCPDGGHEPIIQRQIRLAREAGIYIIGVGVGSGAQYVKGLFDDYVYSDKIREIPKMLIAKLNELADVRGGRRGKRVKKN